MFKIESIAINNFKNIVDTDIPLGDFNVVVGPNNSGKSNFLQLIPFLRWLINGDVKEVEKALEQGYLTGFIHFFKNELGNDDLNVRLTFTNTSTDNVFLYEIKLKNKEENPFIQLTINQESLHYKNKSATGKAIRIFEQIDGKVEFGKEFFSAKIIEQVPSYVSVLRHLNLIAETKTGPLDYKEAINGLDEILNSPIFFFSSSELRKRVSEKPITKLRFRSIYTDLRENVIALKKSSHWDAFLSIISSTLNITNVDLGDSFLLKQLGTDKLLDEFSDGSLLILSFITEVLMSKSSLILLEEPENSLHPKALTEIIRFLQSQTPEKQFILTTHSPALLNLVKPEDVIVARLDKVGNSRLEKIENLRDLKRKLNKGYVSFGDLLIDNIDEPQDGEDKEY